MSVMNKEKNVTGESRDSQLKGEKKNKIPAKHEKKNMARKSTWQEEKKTSFV